MNQIPCVPITNPYMVQQQTTYMPVPQQPKLNAVNIEINNPSVGTQGIGQQPQYEQTTMPYYTYPQAPVYAYPQAPVQPYYPPVELPQAPVAQAPVQVPAAPAPVEVPTTAPVAAPVEAPVVQQQNINVPQVPVAVEAPITEAPSVPEPVVSAPQAAAVDAKPEVVPSETIAPQVDMNAFIAKLANPDFDVQVQGMEEISDLIKNSPEKATELVDTKVFDALTNIINFDSSKLEKATPEQVAAREKLLSGQQVTDEEKALANTPSAEEKAERNKCFALFTSAMMQKLYADEVTRLSNTTVPLTELPGAITIVDTLKDNPNPMVRASAIEALSYIQNPAYKKDLTTVFTIAQNDSDPGVAESAKVALEKLNQV